MDDVAAPAAFLEEHQEGNMHAADDMFYSPVEKENILRIQQQEFGDLFPVGSVFPTRSHLIATLRQKAATFGFFIVDLGMAAYSSETTSRDAANAKKLHARQQTAQGIGRPFIPRKSARSQSVGANSRLTFVLLH